jgi:2-amino-4-hydroxy-6-hydroxymethyldihydropteridine diphosphokinase
MAGLRRISDPRSDPPRGGWAYLLALGSNQRHGRHGLPGAVLRAALVALAQRGLTVQAVAPTISSAPMGPSLRRYANGAVVVRTGLAPPALLALLKSVERDFGRRRGRRWGARVLDLDIVLWQGGVWRQADLAVPHVAYRARDFVLRPAVAVAGHWRDPVCGRSVRQIYGRLGKARPQPHTGA